MRVLGSSDHVVIVGAGLAGWRFVEAVRREGYDGALTLIGAERHAPYDRPPLSKQLLVGKWPPDHLTLATDDLIARAHLTLRLGAAATRLDVATRTVHLSDGTAVRGTHVVIATGTRARRLPFQADAKIHSIRTLDDVARLNDELLEIEAASTVVVIGGGFIGAEVATGLRTRGFTPIILEAALRPLVNVLGSEVSSWLVGLAAGAGIELRSAQQIDDVVVDGEALSVRFVDGSALSARAVVEGVGVLTNVEWLATSGLTLSNGVVVNEHMLATDAVAAIGDVARFTWASVTGTDRVRIEHWQVATEHAAALAHYWVTGEPLAAMLIPYFWSDQYGKKIQLLGHPRADDDVRMVSGSEASEKWLALYSRHGTVTGVVTLSNPRALMLSRPLLTSPTTLDEALERAPWAV